MNKSWLSGLSNVEPPKRKATRPSERLLARAWQPARGLWVSGRQAPPVQAQESSNESLWSVSHRNSVAAHFVRKHFSVSMWNSPQMTAILIDISFHWHDGWILGTGEEGGDRAMNAVMTAMPLHHCSFSQSGWHYVNVNGRVEFENLCGFCFSAVIPVMTECTAASHPQPASLSSKMLAFFFPVDCLVHLSNIRVGGIGATGGGWYFMLRKLNWMKKCRSLICLMILDPRFHPNPSDKLVST